VIVSAGNTLSGGISAAAAQDRIARKKPMVVDDLYRFQARDKKKSELVTLRKQFGDAQKHLQQVRASRIFKPD
jgi:hypothetical protein